MSNISCEKEKISILREYSSRALRCISIPVPDWEGYYSNIKNIVNIAQSSISDTDNRLMSKDDADWVEQYGDVSGVRDALSNDNAIVLTVINKLWPNGAPNGIVGNEEIAAELDRRLMPPGYEWPRYEDGEQVLLSEGYGDDVIDTVAFHYQTAVIDFKSPFIEINPSLIPNSGSSSLEMGERIKRPKLVSIGADGLYIKENETVYVVDGDGTPFTAVQLPTNECYQSIVVRLPNGSTTTFDPPRLTHTKPERLEAFVHGDSRSYI